MSADASGPGSTTGGRRVVDEALRLVEALRDSGAAPAGRDAAAGLAAGLAALGGEHAGPECRVCPVCRAVAAVRALRPEAVEHLAVAAAELASAWREVVAATPAAPPPAGPRSESPVERIDVTD